MEHVYQKNVLLTVLNVLDQLNVMNVKLVLELTIQNSVANVMMLIVLNVVNLHLLVLNVTILILQKMENVVLNVTKDVRNICVKVQANVINVKTVMVKMVQTVLNVRQIIVLYLPQIIINVVDVNLIPTLLTVSVILIVENTVLKEDVLLQILVTLENVSQVIMQILLLKY